MPGYWLTRIPYGAYAVGMLHCSCNAQSFGLALAQRVTHRPHAAELCVLKTLKMVEMKKPGWHFSSARICCVLSSLVSIRQTNSCGSCRFFLFSNVRLTVRLDKSLILTSN